MKNKFFYLCMACIAITSITLITSFNEVTAQNASVYGGRECKWKQFPCSDGSNKYYDICAELIGDGEGCRCGSVTRNCIGGGGGGGAE